MTGQSQPLMALEEIYWIAFDQEEPFGPARLELSLARIAQLIQNVNSKKQDRKPLTDFLPFYRKRAKVDENVDSKLLSVFSNLMKK